MMKGKNTGSKPQRFVIKREGQAQRKPVKTSRDESAHPRTGRVQKPVYSSKPSYTFPKPAKPRKSRSSLPDSYNPMEKEFTVPRYKARANQPKLIRLNKYIANSGLCSRREADEYIQGGKVTVNGQLVTELGVKVKPADEVKVNGRLLMNEQKVYLVINKPKDYLTTREDGQGRRTVMDLIKNACSERVFPVGRLDRNTTGVLLLTNDGELTEILTHPSYAKRKIYQVTLDRKLSLSDFESIANGIELEDGMVKVDQIDFINPGDHATLGVEIHSGKNRIVRRIFEHLGYKIKALDRVYFAGITKKGLQRGHWRFLTPAEVSMLYTGKGS